MNPRTQHFPDLGFGLGLRIPHYAHIFEHQPEVGWFEIISENFMDTGGKARRNLARVREHYPIVMHGVSLSIGSVDVLNSEYLRKLKQLAQDIEPAWISDHLCWTGVAHRNLHDLLPVPYTEEALKHIVGRVQQVQDYLGRPIALENPSTYLEFSSSQIPEAEFIAELARQSGCHLLLDVNNVYVSCFNHRLDPKQYLDALPLDRVVQIHLSGHSHCGTHIIDTHDDHVVDPVWALYEYVLGRAGRVPNTMIEWDANIPPWEVLYAELDKAKAIARRVHDVGGVDGVDVGLAQPQLGQLRTPVGLPAQTVDLDGEQRRMQGTILKGAADAEAVASTWIRPKDEFAAAEQIAVYINAYRSRLYEVTAEDFPVLQHHLGDDRFAALLTDFVNQTPSLHFNIARYSSGLPTYLARVMPHDALAQELARLEDAICQLQDAPETTALTQEHLAGLTADDVQRAVLELRSASRLFAFDYPLDAYYTAVREGLMPGTPEPEPSFLLVYRHDDVVWRMALDEAEYHLLQALSAGVAVGEACAGVQEQRLPEGETVEAAISRWFSRWIRNGVIRHPVRLAPHSSDISPETGDHHDDHQNVHA